MPVVVIVRVPPVLFSLWERTILPKGERCQEPRRAPTLTTTSYAILGLLAVKPWTTHELVQQVDRSLRRIWPRAASKLYEEPKKLVAHGYARATDDSVGRRPRTRYTITAKGRRALAAWLSQPGDGPVLECEQLVKIHFADSGTKADVLANLEATRAWVLDAEPGEPGHRPCLPRRARRLPRTRRPEPADRAVPHRLLRDGRPLGRLGDTTGRDLARRCDPGAFDTAEAAEAVRLAESIPQLLDPGEPVGSARPSDR